MVLGWFTVGYFPHLHQSITEYIFSWTAQPMGTTLDCSSQNEVHPDPRCYVAIQLIHVAWDQKLIGDEMEKRYLKENSDRAQGPVCPKCGSSKILGCGKGVMPDPLPVQRNPRLPVRLEVEFYWRCMDCGHEFPRDTTLQAGLLPTPP